MKTSRRSSLQIVAEILTLCRRPQTRTRILQKVYLSYKTAQDLLARLETSRLLEVHHNEKKYVTTDRGERFLDLWGRLQEIDIS